MKIFFAVFFLCFSVFFNCFSLDNTIPNENSYSKLKLVISDLKSSYWSRNDFVKTDTIEIINNIDYNSKEFLQDLNETLKQSSGYLILVDKNHRLRPSYEPNDLVKLDKSRSYDINLSNLSLRREVEQAVEDMAQFAAKVGMKIMVSSTYRTYDYQLSLYEKALMKLGYPDPETAVPGESQHQLGTAIDFGTIDHDFLNSPAGVWIYKNAHLFGFSLSFPKNYEMATGYPWESWHFRYLGKEAVEFQRKWFKDIQQYMLEFIYFWNNYE